MSRYGTEAGTRCTDDTHVDTSSAPATDPALSGTPETPPAIEAADVSYCTSASGLDQVKCQLLLFIAEILNLIASFIGHVLVFLVDILITFAAYNGFGDAIVVQRGWIVVRDVVNMFFIVVLLVSAFATIIGYDEGNFHYKRVLPKLLLMAVLINFSRTLIQLLIDFSQVIMLTFVNAFASAGPGNLVSALKLDRVLAMAPPSGGGTVESAGAAAGLTGTVDPVNIILALMLAIFMLSISLGVVIIMTAFLIVRIVGLWIALILSPLALFATALPGRLQKSLNAFTGSYWQKLTSALTGGPVMAFFLWLTFAITQSAAGEGGLAQAVNLHTSNPTVSFLTTIGNSQDIASFIVGITLMLMGLDAAVSAADSLSHTLGSYAKKVSGASQALGRLAATAPFLGAYYGGRAVDRRLDLSGKAATAAFAATSAVPGLRSLTRAPLIAAMGRNKKLDKAEAADYQKGLEYLSPKQRAIASFATPAGALATKGQKQAYVQQMTERAGEKNAKAMKEPLEKSYTVQMTQRREEELKAQGLSGAALQTKLKEDEGMIKNRASQYADRDVEQRQAYLLDKAKQTAESAGDSDAVKQIDDQLKKNPNLSLDKMKLAKKLIQDPKALADMSTQAKSDMGTLYALLDASGAIQKDPHTGNIIGFDRAKTDNFTSKLTDKDLKENLGTFMKLSRESVGQYGQKDMEQMVIGKDEKGKKRILKLPVNQAGKLPQLGAELERATSIRPTGPEAILGNVAAASLEPVISADAQAAKNAFANNPLDVTNIENMIDTVDAGQVFQNAPSWNTYRTAAANAAGNLNAGAWDPAAAVGTPDYRSKADVDTAMSKFETLASKMGDMAENQRTQFMADMAAQNIDQMIVKAKKSGYASGKSRNETLKKFMEQMVKLETDIKQTGRLPTQEEQDVQASLDRLRAQIQDPANRSVSAAYRTTLEPEET